MKTWFFLLLSILLSAYNIHYAASKSCGNNTTQLECNATEYESYVDCIRSRMKRSADCYEDDEEEDCSTNDCGYGCDNCNCDECTSRHCGKSCNKRCCNSCCEFKECSTNHCCHKVCHNSCRTSSCRSSCRKTCYKGVKTREPKTENRFISGGIDINEDRTATNSSNSMTNSNAHNITTIIQLNNLINNTNVIDVPVNLNNSNFNNITLENSQNSSSAYGPGNSQCCSVIEPRKCVQTPVYPFIDCFHIRRQQCGQFCKAPVVHKVAQNVCYNTQTQNPTCGQQIIYVPEPRSSCGYQPQWPYIMCTNQGGNCNGCYDYLLNPYRTQGTCGSSCYNYGVNQGTMFGQGPVFGPGYSLPPPPINPMMPSGCSGYGGCSMMNMASFINPGMYYGMNPYNNYGIYGSFNPTYMQGYGANMGLQLGNYGNPFGMPLPTEQFVVMNFTANSNSSLYGLLTNASIVPQNIGGLPGNMYNPTMTIDEETFKKLLGQSSNVEQHFETVKTTVKVTETAETNTPSTEYSIFGR